MINPRDGFEARLAALERARRRERAISATTIAVLLIGLHSWSPQAQAPKPLDQRVADLEKRIGIFGGGAAANEPIKFQTPFVIRSASGEIVMKVDDPNGRATLELGAPTAGGVSLGADDDGGGFVNVRSGFGRPAIELAGDPMGVRVFGPDGQSVQGALELNDKGNGQLTVGLSSGGGATLGIGDTGSGFALTRRPSGAIGVDIGRLDGGPEGVYVLSDSGKRAATLVADPAGGRLTVMNAGGAGVGGLLATPAGGRVAVTGAGGGNSLATLAASAGGGVVNVFAPAGGSPRATLAADDNSGSVTIFDPQGLGVAWLESGDSGSSGRMVIADNGDMRVEAGSLESGIGIVRTGPGGRAGGGMGIPGSFIMGKK